MLARQGGRRRLRGKCGGVGKGKRYITLAASTFPAHPSPSPHSPCESSPPLPTPLLAPPAMVATLPYTDVIVVGAGISGINAAYRIQTETSCSYTVLEARDEIGGTWSLFKYP